MSVCHVSKIVQMVPNRAKQHISLHLESGVNSMSARVQSVIYSLAETKLSNPNLI